MATGIITKDYAVPHTSTNPANVNDSVELFVREYDGTKPSHSPEAVLMLHGRSTPALPGYDLEHGRHDRYSWSKDLADAGYDVFIMDLQGSGRSTRPKMDNPCNANPAQQPDILVPNPLSAPCSPVYTSQLNNSQSDWDELDTVIKFIQHQRGVSKVRLVGWSAAAFVMGPYAVQHPQNVESLLLLAPIFPPQGRASKPGTDFGAPVALPVSTPAALFGFPMHLGTKEAFASSWDRELHCANQREPGMVDVVWDATMDNDTVGSGWGPMEDGVAQGVNRIRNSYWWGWNSTTVPLHGTLGRDVPVCIVYGELDTQANTPVSSGPLLHFSVPALYDAVPGTKKLMFRVACTGHLMVWERQSKFLHHMSRQWLKHGTVEGLSSGSYFRDEDGVIMPAA